MKKLTLSRKSRRLARGQAMVEYSAINWILLMGLLTIAGAPIVPWYNGTTNLVDAFFQSYQVYYDSFYFVLNMPFP